MSKNRNVVYNIIILLCLISCNNKHAQTVISLESRELGDKGFLFWNEYLLNDGDSSLLDSALFYYNKAIAKDKNNVVAFWNKNSVLYEQKKYDELVVILTELLEKTDPFDYQSRASLNANLAQKYHQMGDSIMEQNTLLTAKYYYQLGLREELNESFVDDYILFTAYTSGKDTALIELEKYKVVLKDFISYEIMKEHIISNSFDY